MFSRLKYPLVWQKVGELVRGISVPGHVVNAYVCIKTASGSPAMLPLNESRVASYSSHHLCILKEHSNLTYSSLFWVTNFFPLQLAPGIQVWKMIPGWEVCWCISTICSWPHRQEDLQPFSCVCLHRWDASKHVLILFVCVNEVN